MAVALQISKAQQRMGESKQESVMLEQQYQQILEKVSSQAAPLLCGLGRTCFFFVAAGDEGGCEAA